MITWKLDRPAPCAGCGETVYPHQSPVQVGAQVYHPEHAPAAPTGIGAVENPVLIAAEHREEREAEAVADLERVRRALRELLELAEESGAIVARGFRVDPQEARSVSKAHADMAREAKAIVKSAVPVTYSIVLEHALNSERYEFLARVAEAEIAGRNPACGTRWRHVTVIHLQDRHHRRYPALCHDPNCFRCWRFSWRSVVDRHDTAIDDLLEQRNLWFAMVPWPARPEGVVLAQKLDAWMTLLPRVLGKRTPFLAAARPDALLILFAMPDAGVRLGSSPVKDWADLYRLWIPVEPFNMMCPEGWAWDAYSASYRGADGKVHRRPRLVRGRGMFARPTRPKTKTVTIEEAENTTQRLIDDVTLAAHIAKAHGGKADIDCPFCRAHGRRKAIKVVKPVCPVCGEPAEKITSLTLAAGEFCPDCPERAAKDRNRLDAYAATGPPR